jgi:putative ABC transport system permease protein
MGLTHWFRRRPSDDEMREELEAHIAMRAEHDHVDEGAARRRLGNVLHTREAMRRVWIAQWWDALRQDAWFTWRSWRRQPGFALGAICVLALGLGASTALFAALDRVLFRPLPYTDPNRLVSVGVVTARPSEPFADQLEGMLDADYVRVWNETPAPFASVTAMDTSTCEIAGEQPEDTRCGTVDANFLRVLGVRLVLGRDFSPQDDVRGAPRVALISHALWVRRFGADPEVAKRTLNLETARYGPLQQVSVIGVLPPDFEMPVEAAEILLPSQLRPLDPKVPFATMIMAFARLKPGVTPERAEMMLAPQLRELSASPAQRVWRVRPVRDRRVGDAARVAWLLVGAVAAFLLIACVNVANLMLARVAERQREFAVRAALGAGTLRLARLAAAESLLLALTAGVVGLLLAFALLDSFAAMAPVAGAVAQSVAEASVDVRVFVVAALLAVITGVTISLWPAISVFRAGGMQGLRSTSSSSPGARPRARFALVTMQIALTLALLGGSGLLLRSLWNVVNVPLGFDSERVVTLTVFPHRTRYPTPDHVAAFLDALLSRAQATPGAVSAALSDAPPPPRPPRGRGPVSVEGQPADPRVPRPTIGFRWVTPQYFDTFGIRVVRGRTPLEADAKGEPAVVLNESAERALFLGERAPGRRIQTLAFSAPINSKPVPSPWRTVLGVSADVRNGEGITDEPRPEIYFIARPGSWQPIGRLSLRTTASPADAAAYLRQIAADLDPQQLVTIQTGDELLTLLTAQPRFIAWLLTAFAALALLLAAAGLYSVASYLVTQRRRDIGVRIAIGASPRDVARQVVGEAGRWIIGGALVGAALGWMGTRALQSQLYQVQALDPWSWTGALGALVVVLVIAVFRPAYRAAHVDPVAALRAD